MRFEKRLFNRRFGGPVQTMKREENAD